MEETHGRASKKRRTDNTNIANPQSSQMAHAVPRSEAEAISESNGAEVESTSQPAIKAIFDPQESKPPPSLLGLPTELRLLLDQRVWNSPTRFDGVGKALAYKMLEQKLGC